MVATPEPETTLLPARPSLIREYARSLLPAGGRRKLTDSVPDTQLRLSGVRVDRDNLASYQHLCGFGVSDLLPLTYPHLLSFPLQVKLMAAPEFPLPLPGLVHLRNEIDQQAQLTADDGLDVMVSAAGPKPHPKGVTVDLVTTVKTAGQPVWSSRSTYLRRGPAREAQADAATPPGVPDNPPVAQWRLSADLGRRYAAVSGDLNPIHLYSWTARALGFRRAIAHGMWTCARTLAALGPSTASAGRCSVWFRKPVLLPGTVALRRAEQPDGTHVAALVGRGDVVHLVLMLR